MTSYGTSLLLEPLGTVIVPEINEPFTADTGPEEQVKVFFLEVSFEEWFSGKVEEPSPATAFRYAKLTKYSLDEEVLKELGDHAETKLGQAYRLMSLQPQGEEGVLLTNGDLNVFYVRDGNNILCVVNFYWVVGRGWRVGALRVEAQLGSLEGSRVFSQSP